MAQKKGFGAYIVVVFPQPPSDVPRLAQMYRSAPAAPSPRCPPPRGLEDWAAHYLQWQAWP